MSRGGPDPSPASRIVELLLPALIVWNLFLFVLKDHAYPLASAEAALGLLILALLVVPLSLLALVRWHRWYAIGLAALLTWLIDFRTEGFVDLHKAALAGLFLTLIVLCLKLRHALYLPTAAALTVMLVTTAGLLFTQSPARIAAFDRTGAGADAPPRFIHLILDEHLGIEGFPDSHALGRLMKNRVRAFYQDHGFRLYGGAYGHYSDTYEALSNLVNFARAPTIKPYVVGQEAPFRVTQNRYFELLKERHYRLHVIGAGFLDFCSQAQALTVDCQDYRFSSWSSIAALDRPATEKTAFLLRAFATRYHRYQRLRQLYETSWRPALASRGDVLSRLADAPWVVPPAHTYAANAMEVIDGIWENVATLPHGHAAFIHLMLPHFPYSFGPQCTARPMSDWKDKMEDVPDGQRTVELQASRYRLYFEQMDCVLTLLDQLFIRMRQAGTFDDSIIVIHGDHGSRLGIRDPVAEAMPLADTDLFDNFSLLYAVKMPGLPGGYNGTPRPIEDLLIDTLGLPVSVTEAASHPPAPHFVFLRPPPGTGAYLPVPYPAPVETSRPFADGRHRPAS